MKLHDLTGQRFGKLTVKKYLGNSKWLCECDCGCITEVFSNNLIRLHTTSCGCTRGKGIINKRFGQLLVIKKTEDGKYLCQCDCGNLVTRNYESLVTKSTVSCDECARKARGQIVKEKVFVDGTMPAAIKIDKKPTKANKSGVVGVNWDKSRGKWQSSIRFKGHKYNLGRFDNIEDAIKIRKDAEEKYFGTFLKWYEEYKKTKH